MPKVVANGKEYDITTDGFGVHYVNGKTIQQFTNEASDDEILYFAKRGLEIMESDPEYSKDIIERGEIVELES